MPETVKFDDATRPQVAAADPGSASWVSANAGSGKTRVLTDRVARLLLAGTPPQRILCLTFTIAAANNMQVRLFERLGAWSMLSDAELRIRLLELGESEKSLNKDKLENARTLFARALETPGGLKIQTIHAFSSALLKQFPLEAGVSPKFNLIDDLAANSLQGVILDELAEESPDVFNRIAREISESGFSDFLEDIKSRREGLQPPAGRETVLRQFGVETQGDAEQMVSSAASSLFTHDDVSRLNILTDALRSDTGSDRSLEAAKKITEILAIRNTESALHALAGYFLTGVSSKNPFSPSAGSPRKLAIKHLDIEFHAWLDQYKVRVQQARSAVINIRGAEKTLALHEFAEAFLSRYDQRKREGALLDFSDLILKSLRLLQDQECAQWVLYRLDGGIDHVLIDEAQDVSPTQWEIVSEIAREFTAGLGAREGSRTVFAVGDEKQSIYGFQGAAPERFDAMRRQFKERYEDAGLNFIETSLQYSFRSSQAILSLVDAVFRDCQIQGFASGVTHRAFKEDLPGRVDLWPFIDGVPVSDSGSWDETAPIAEEPKSHDKLAKAIALRVKNMLEGGDLLPEGTGGRTVRPGDIMILVRRRSDLFYAIINELKANGLPVAGADRLKLIEELAVRDLTAMLSFLAYNRDDLSLAAVLRSPLFGLTEDQLFDLAHGRGKQSLWGSLLKSGADFPDTVRIISDLMKCAREASPYEILERILTRHEGREKLTARLGHEIEETLDSYLQQALTYEEEESASLTGFLNWLTQDTEIKRQLDQGVNEIRVMTIHGAKGLESPIVILPDTEKRSAHSAGTIETSPVDGMPLFMVKRDESPEIIESAREAKKLKEKQEEFRLLYVALTRAECWLIVCGEGNGRGDCWYVQIQSGLAGSDAEQRDFSSEAGHYVSFAPGVRYSTGEWPELTAPETGAAPAETKVPDWVGRAPDKPEPLPGPLSPSGLGGFIPSQAADSEFSEDAASEAAAFGKRVHLLLEHLPRLPREKRPAAARSILELHNPSAEAAENDEAFEAAERLLDDPKLEFLFTGGSIAEAGITAASPTLNGRQLFGYIDCLLVGEERVLAVDFKSNRAVPDCPEDIPEGILRQMGAYQEALRAVYPDLRTETAILWTRTANLMMVPAEICQEALERAAASQS